MTSEEWDDLCDQVDATGFYSTWLAVARAFDPQLAQLLATTLNARATAPGASSMTFKGVDVVNDVIPFL
jgi:hypothetical protein